MVEGGLCFFLNILFIRVVIGKWCLRVRMVNGGRKVNGRMDSMCSYLLKT